MSDKNKKYAQRKGKLSYFMLEYVWEESAFFEQFLLFKGYIDLSLRQALSRCL
jgi:hypothetical protein